ncbi:nitrate reductase [Azonexus sp.]|uniref:nitrate reductase n=1 Tax=Azonexus sp. TaxID=1872668 RepID=UPI0027BA30F5|nr:nitrate reductase [Azonexus sp.]
MNQEVKSTCCYCGVGCGVLIRTDGITVQGVRGDPEHPANYGRLCTKGASLHLTAQGEGRLRHPALRPARDRQPERLAWAQALDTAAERFAGIIREHGPDSVAFYISGQLMTEDYYVFNKLAKGLIGTNNVDTNSRLCMSSAVAGYKQTLGADAPPCCYEDIGQAGVILIAGANPALAHPIVFRYIEDARAANPALKIIVVDPRRSETAEIADLHLPILPGSDIALFNGMLHVMLAEGLVDGDYIARHTSGFDELAGNLAEYTPQRVAGLCGIPASSIVRAARWFATQGPALSLYCQGLNQSAHGTHNNAALIHLHLATGQIGKPGAGPFSLTGQPNAMGGREVGGLANLLSAHRDLANPEHRAEVAALWGIPDVPAKPGKAAVDLFKALESGEIKAVWIACTNPAQSLPNQASVRAGLARAEFVVLQETFADTDTAAYADLLLPATGWGEKHGTVTNSERRITRVQPAVVPLGEARHDWQIVVDFARRLGRKLENPVPQGDFLRGAVDRLFPYETVESIFAEHCVTTRGRDLDISGLSYAVLEQQGPQQWPFPEGASQGRQRLYADGRFPTADGRARFIAVTHQATAEVPGKEHPLSLLSGRLRDQWHGMSRTGIVPRLFNLDDEPLLAMHPCDMRHRQLDDGDLVRLFNGRGEIVVRVASRPGLARGRVWMPMHWGSRFMNSAGVNALVGDAVDPYSQQPELKHTAVEVAKSELNYPLAVIRRCSDVAEALRVLDAARSLLPDFAYASVGLYGRASPLVVFRAATAEPATAPALAAIDRCFGLDGETGAIVYTDAKRHIAKKAIAIDGQLFGVRLAGETVAQAWLKQAMAEGELDASLLRFALAPSAAAPTSTAPRQIVCKCADVSDKQITTAIDAGADLTALQENLKCGTFCGGCIPDIKRLLLRQVQQQPEAA